MGEPWVEVRLGDVASATSGRYLAKTEYVDDGPFWVYGSNSIMGRYDQALVQVPHVVMAAVGAYAGAVRYSSEPSWVNNNAFALVPSPTVDAFFLYLWLDSGLDPIQVLAGTGQPYVKRPVLMEQKLRLPPLAVQRQIINVVADLDEHLLNLRVERDVIQAVALELCSGDTTSTNPLGGRVRARGGKRMPKGEGYAGFDTGHPYLRVVDMAEGTFSRNALEYVPLSIWPSIQRYVVRRNEIVVSIVGTIGRVALVPEWADGANLTENAAVVDLTSADLDPEWLAFWLRSKAGQDEIERVTVGTSQGKLALSRIPLIEVPVVTKERQVELARAAVEAQNQATCLTRELLALEAVRSLMVSSLLAGELEIAATYRDAMAGAT